ncbi:zinc-binding dehydrogenase [Streptomyces vinaceus]|uniref:zinc-binding dehydrogenase n=1 Tax=Streptomyces vinaceus TaxID=1960 RepID=UPI001AD71CEF
MQHHQDGPGPLPGRRRGRGLPARRPHGRGAPVRPRPRHRRQPHAPPAARPDDLRTLGELIESGALTPALDRTYPLAEVPDAIRRLRDGRVRGKIAVRVGDSGHGARPGAEPAEGG